MSFWDEAEAEIAAKNRAAYDASQTPEALARTAARRQADHERGVRLGWWSEDGTPLPQDDDPDDPDDEDEETAP